MGLCVGAGVADQQRVQTLAILSARRTAFEVRSHASDCGVGARELELDVAVDLLEGLIAAELRSAGTGEGLEQEVCTGEDGCGWLSALESLDAQPAR